MRNNSTNGTMSTAITSVAVSTAIATPALNMTDGNTTSSPPLLDLVHNILHGFSSLTVLVFIVLAIVFFKKYCALSRTVRDLAGKLAVVTVAARGENCATAMPLSPVTLQEYAERMPLQQQNKTRTLTAILPWTRPLQQGPRFTKADLSLEQLIKAGKDGAFYKARMTRGTCKGHDMFTCKIATEGVSLKRVDTEVAIMKKLVHHKNILQLLDWNTSEDTKQKGSIYRLVKSWSLHDGSKGPVIHFNEPYVLIMELVSYGTLRSFLQTHRESLSVNPELQSLLTISSYHIALAMEHLRSKMPYVLIMELVSYGTLRSFLQTHRESLSVNPELQSLLTISSYHIALAMEHLRSKMVVHCDLALRNVLVSRFPWEVKLAEFGLARDLTHMRSRCSSRWKATRQQQRVPLRWYPPEYFRNNHYSFKGDVWAFGILLWEMQTFGTTPYPSLDTSEAVVYHICAGYKNSEPEGCRPELLQMLRDCWAEPYTSRPSFTDIVRILEDVIENDADYVDVQ